MAQNHRMHPTAFVRFFGVVGLGLTVASSALSAADAPVAERLLNAGRPLVIGHRGYNVLAPENTLPAFRFAQAAGADLIELDYHHSRDGIPVVIHDAELDRTTDAVAKWGRKGIRVETKTVAELQSLDAGRWFGPAFAGTRLPLLTDALDLIQRGSVTLIERKGGDADPCVRLLRARNLINAVVVQSFDWRFLKDFHGQAPEQILGALGPPGTRQGRKLTDAEKTLSPEWIDEARQSGVKVIGWNKLTTRAAIDYAHRHGLRVWVYTLNDAAQANEALDQGADGIITDNPSQIWRAIALRGLSALPAR